MRLAALAAVTILARCVPRPVRRHASPTTGARCVWPRSPAAPASTTVRTTRRTTPSAWRWSAAAASRTAMAPAVASTSCARAGSCSADRAASSRARTTTTAATTASRSRSTRRWWRTWPVTRHACGARSSRPPSCRRARAPRRGSVRWASTPMSKRWATPSSRRARPRAERALEPSRADRDASWPRCPSSRRAHGAAGAPSSREVA